MKKFIKYFVPAVAILAIVSVVAIRCTKPTDGISITVNTSTLFHYNTLVQISDPSKSSGIPGNLSVSVTGPDAAAIYGLDGRKALTVATGGIITIAVHPKMEPTASHPLSFNLVITGSGYLPLIIPVTISTQQKSQLLKASIVNLNASQPGVIASKTETHPITNGVVVAPITISTPATTANPEATSVTLPAGTKLMDAGGNVIPSNSVVITTNNFNTSNADAINLFPGGSLAAASNITPGSGGKSSAVFLPADFVNIQMTANGIPVRNFSGPVTVTMTLDPNFRDPVSGNVITAGSTLNIYSYSTDTGMWSYERDATVTTDISGNFMVTFTTNHLTEYVVGRALDVLQKLSVDVNAPWYVNGTATNIRIIGAIPNGPSYDIFDQTFQLDSLKTFILDGKLPMPPAGSSVILSFSNAADGSQLGTATILPGNDGTLSVTLSQPAQNAAVTLGLSLDCRNANQHKIIVPPNFYLLYKQNGTPASSYNILGQVQNGTITTTQLDPNLSYDFEAIFNGNVKEVLNHKVTGNQSTTVGNTSFNGVVVPGDNIVDIKSLCDQLQ